MVFAYFTPVTGLVGGALMGKLSLYTSMNASVLFVDCFASKTQTHRAYVLLVDSSMTGLSAAVLLLCSGDILGASSIASSPFLHPKRAVNDCSTAWKLVFLSTFLLFSNLVLGPFFTTDERLGNDPQIMIPSVYGYLIGGLFIGFGSRLGNGCTAGHGICGMPRLSQRSIVAVCVFMAAAFITATVISPDNKAFAKGTAFLRTDKPPVLYNRWWGFGTTMLIVLPTIYAFYNMRKKKVSMENCNKETCHPNTQPKTCTNRESVTTIKTVGGDSSNFIPINTSAAVVSNHLDVENPPPTIEEEVETQQQQQEEQQQHEEEREEGNFDEDEKDFDGDEKVTEEPLEWEQEPCRKVLPAIFAAALFATGLAVSQMVLPSKIIGFLALYTFATKTYDPTLMLVMIGAAVVSFISYQFVNDWGILKNPYARDCPFMAKSFSVPKKKQIDWKLVSGACCFGMGWGVSGLCPGPAMFLAATGTKPVIFYWWPTFIAGSFLAQKIRERNSSSLSSPPS